MRALVVSAVTLLSACAPSTAQPDPPAEDVSSSQQTTPHAATTLADLQAADFSRYPAQPYTGARHMPDFNGGAAREYRIYRTLLGQGAAQGPNFAGRFALVQLGCGAGCNATYQIDLATGGITEITFAPSVVDIQNRADSALLKARWFIAPRELDGRWKCHYENYEWRDDRLISLGQAETDGGCPDEWWTP